MAGHRLVSFRRASRERWGGKGVAEGRWVRAHLPKLCKPARLKTVKSDEGRGEGMETEIGKKPLPNLSSSWLRGTRCG